LILGIPWAFSGSFSIVKFFWLKTE
jgi:hypothetical protein